MAEPGEKFPERNADCYCCRFCQRLRAGSKIYSRVRKGFAEMMTKRARTRAKIPISQTHGLHDENHYTTPMTLSEYRYAVTALHVEMTSMKEYLSGRTELTTTPTSSCGG